MLEQVIGNKARPGWHFARFVAAHENQDRTIAEKIRDATGEDRVFGTSPDCPAEIEEAFLERVLAFETSPKRTLFDVLSDLEVDLPRLSDIGNKLLN